jgi:hypothetical protein
MAGTISDVMHDLLNKLRIIAQVKEGQKLDTTNGLDVYTEGWINWAFRKWYRDSKDEGIRFLRELYRSLQQSVETVVGEYNNSPNKTRRAMAINVLMNTAVELKSSVRGLDNLRKTYMGYPSTVAHIHGIIRDYVIVTYATLLDVIPAKKLTDDLRESITFDAKIIYNGIDGMHIPAKASNVDDDEDDNDDEKDEKNRVDSD